MAPFFKSAQYRKPISENSVFKESFDSNADNINRILCHPRLSVASEVNQVVMPCAALQSVIVFNNAFFPTVQI